MYHNFIGIDIGKTEFYVAIHGNKLVKSFSNNDLGFDQFINEYPQLNESLVVLETTGGYEMQLLEHLCFNNIKVHRANTRIVKSFIRSTGKLGKSDKIDAIGLARYGYERHTDLTLYTISADIDKERLQLSNRRHDLVQMIVQEKNRAKAPDNAFVKANCQNMIKYLETNIKEIDERLALIIEQDEELKVQVNVLSDIPGVGRVTAIKLLNLMPELGKLNRRQVASLSGTAPHPYESGSKIGYRNTRGGRANVKTALYMSAMAASKSNGVLGDYYKSLIVRGKKPIVALTALMRKIVVIANARLRDMNKQLVMQ